MPFWYRTEIMPSGSATDIAWLNALGAAKWQLAQVVPMSPITPLDSTIPTVATGSAKGQVLCYFISGSNT